MPAQVHPVHFPHFSGYQFERLVFAFHVRDNWRDLIWRGQSGGDQGRDIEGVELRDDGPNRRTIIQCANRATLTENKAVDDMTKAVSAALPEAFRFVCGGRVSDTTRVNITAAAKGLGVNHVTIWSGPEFEEQLRLRGQFLLERFMNGVEFPASEREIRDFVEDFPEMNDADKLRHMAALFKRPAFETRFEGETQLPGFQQALEDTIRALNTGIWNTREGDLIRNIPSVHNLHDPQIRGRVEQVARQVNVLHSTFVTALRKQRIRPCSCGVPTCHMFEFDQGAAAEMDEARQTVLRTFQSVYPDLEIHLH